MFTRSTLFWFHLSHFFLFSPVGHECFLIWLGKSERNGARSFVLQKPVLLLFNSPIGPSRQLFRWGFVHLHNSHAANQLNEIQLACPKYIIWASPCGWYTRDTKMTKKKISAYSLRVQWERINMGHNKDGWSPQGTQKMDWLILIEEGLCNPSG